MSLSSPESDRKLFPGEFLETPKGVIAVILIEPDETTIAPF
jgi:hypothetical protein